MVAEIRITGAEQMRRLGIELKAQGEEGKGLRRELLAAMRIAGKPLVEATRASAMANLPKAGGLNEWVASSNIAARNSLTGSRVGTKVVAKKPGGRKGSHDLEASDAGQIRHPVYGRWLKNQPTQDIPPGWFTKPLLAAAPEVQVALLMALTITEEKLARG